MNSLAFVVNLLLTPLPLGAIAVAAIAYWMSPEDSRIWKVAVETFVGLFAVVRGIAQVRQPTGGRRWGTILILLGAFFFGSAASRLYPSLVLDIATVALMVGVAFTTSLKARDGEEFR